VTKGRPYQRETHQVRRRMSRAEIPGSPTHRPHQLPHEMPKMMRIGQPCSWEPHDDVCKPDAKNRSPPLTCLERRTTIPTWTRRRRRAKCRCVKQHRYNEPNTDALNQTRTTTRTPTLSTMPGHAIHANDDDSHLTTSSITMSHIIHDANDISTPYHRA